MNLIKTQIIQILVCSVLSLVAISILPLIQRVFVNSDQDLTEDPVSTFSNKTYSKLIFTPNIARSYSSHHMIFVVTLVSCALITLETLFVKVSPAFAFVYFAVIFELMMFVKWPIIHGFNDFTHYAQPTDSLTFNRKQSIQKFVRLLLFTPVCMIFVASSYFTSSNFAVIFFVITQYMFNNFMYWIFSKFVFVSPKEQSQNLKAAFSFSKDGIVLISVTLIASILIIKYIHSIS